MRERWAGASEGGQGSRESKVLGWERARELAARGGREDVMTCHMPGLALQSL
jgi:hypothetical protein